VRGVSIAVTLQGSVRPFWKGGNVLGPERLGGDLSAAMRCPVTRRRFLGLAGLAGLGVCVNLHGGTPPDDFYVETVEASQPTFDRGTYRLVVDGLVRRQRSFTYPQLLWLPSARQTCDFRCVEGWGVDDVPWEGIQLSTLMKLTQPLASARFITFHCLGGTYRESLSLEQAQLPYALLAYCMYGHPLPAEHGSPLRLVFPRMLGYKSAKWVTRVEFRAERDLGYWAGFGVDPWVSDPQPCSSISRFGGCRSCRLEALVGQRKLWGATQIPTPTNMPLPAETTQAGQGCGTQP